MTASTARRRPGRSASFGIRYGILASRILPLARTSRWAMVGSGTRKARAISAVVSPPRSRSVSATWATRASAGWQQVKIRRSLSSCTAPSSSFATGSSPASSRAALAWPHLDRGGGRQRQLPAPLEGGVEVGRLDDAAPAQVLLALDIRAVGHEHLPVLGSQHRGRAGGMETVGEDPSTRRLHLLSH